MKCYNTIEAKELARQGKTLKCISEGINKNYYMYFDGEF